MTQTQFVLLDTVALIRLGLGEKRDFSRRLQKLWASTDVTCVVSVVSAWEIGIKHQLGKLPLQIPPQELLPKLISDLRLQTLDIRMNHVLTINQLPPHHKDPFDRLLIAQALCEKWPIVSPDVIFKKYDVEVIW